MNITVIIIEMITMCLVFTLLVLGLLLVNPISFISDYPPEIQAEYYRSQKKERMKEKLTLLMIVKKLVALSVFLFLFVWMLHLAGAETFLEGLLLSYAYVIVLFAWDTFFLDWVVFPNIRRFRLPGTEHMEKEYHQKWFHVKVCIPMIPVFAVFGVLSSLIMLFAW